MRSLLIVDAPEWWSRLAALLADLGSLTIVTRNDDQRVGPALSGPSRCAVPSVSSGWRPLVEDVDAIVFAEPITCLPSLVEALATSVRRPRVLVTVSPDDDDMVARQLGARDAVIELRICRARVGACVRERDGLVRALVPLYSCFVGLRDIADEPAISWCHEYDVARAVIFAIEARDLEGTFDLVTPEPARVRDLDAALSRALGQRPILRISLPTATKLLGDRFARELARGSQRYPEALARRGFSFVFPDIRSAVFDVLGESARVSNS